MSNFNSSDRERLTQLLTQKLDLFTQVCRLCEKQAKLLEEAKMEELNESLDEAQKQRDKINGLHQELESLMQSYALLGETERDDIIDRLSADTQKQIEYCVELNEKNMLMIQSLTEEHTKKIDEQSAKRKGITGYAQGIEGAPEMFDRKS